MKIDRFKETDVASRIKGLDSRSVDAGGARPVEKISRNSAAASATTPSSTAVDDVQITDFARRLAGLAKVINDTPDVDTGRVQALQQSISQGTYTIDAGRIADRVLQLEQDLGGH